jgi:hypothetical protein
VVLLHVFDMVAAFDEKDWLEALGKAMDELRLPLSVQIPDGSR